MGMGVLFVNVIYGEKSDIRVWMDLVRLVRDEFPGLETEEALQDHEKTVLKFMDKMQAICVKEDEKIVGVLLFSRNRNMICCLAVSPEHRRTGIGAKLLQAGVPVAGRLRRENARFGVVEIGGMNHDSKQIAHHVDDNMSFASFCFFPPSMPRCSLAATVLTLWESMMP